MMTEESSRLNFDIESAKTRREDLTIVRRDAMCCCRNVIYITLMVVAIILLIWLILAPVYS